MRHSLPGPLPPVLILHNIPRESPPLGRDPSRAGVMDEVRAVAAALAERGTPHRAAGAARLSDLPALLAASCEPVVFNLVEGLDSGDDEAIPVPSLCRAFGKGCTGGDTECLALSLDKWRSRAVCRAWHLPVPPGVLVPPGRKANLAPLPPGACIAKPARLDASEGIRADCSVFDRDDPAGIDAIRTIHERLGQPALVEQLVGTREVNVSIVQRGRGAQTLPLAEIDFAAFPPDKVRIVDYAAKWTPGSFEYHNTPRRIPAALDEPLAERIRGLARTAWHALGCRDYARVDLRLDDEGNVWILEVNSNPDISPDAGFAAALAAARIPFRDFVADMLANALAREGLDAACAAPADAPDAGDVRIRTTHADDRDPILHILAATALFAPNEIDVAREVLDAAIAAGQAGHYQSFTAADAGRAVGWVCLGPTPCTRGTFDIYWIAVAPARQGRGIGKALMAHAEARIAGRGGRLAVVETSGRPAQQPARRFYEALGYRSQARVADFYAPGDDKVVYAKAIAAP